MSVKAILEPDCNSMANEKEQELVFNWILYHTSSMQIGPIIAIIVIDLDLLLYLQGVAGPRGKDGDHGLVGPEASDP